MTRKSQRELERAVEDLTDSDDEESRPIVGANGIIAPPEWFGYGGEDDAEK